MSDANATGSEWDRQLQEDVKAAGKLEFLKEEVLEARKQGTIGTLDTENSLPGAGVPRWWLLG